MSGDVVHLALQDDIKVGVPNTMRLGFWGPPQTRIVYKLVGVAHHYGSRYQGHYTADCRSAMTGQWLSCNDQCVSAGSWDGRASSSPYLLFYRRQGSL